MVPSTDVSANTDEPATEVANGTGCATMNRRKVATPRRHMLRSIVSGTCGYLVADGHRQATHSRRAPGQRGRTPQPRAFAMMAAMATTRRADMFIDLEDDPRENGPTLGDERTTLVEALRCRTPHVGDEVRRS